MMGGLDVRRLAAVDMYGGAGTRRRRRIILAEFLLGAVVGSALGLWVLASADTVGWRVFGVWVLGVSLNYVPLAWHALSLSPAGRLEAELEGVDVARELRYYTAAQFWVLVPLVLAVLALWQAVAPRRRQSR